MSSVTVGSTTANYVYSATGALIEKTVGGVTTLLMYDEAGHIVGEYSSTGALIQETVWMGDVPVATLRPNGSTGCASTVCLFYVHTSHLGTPVKVTRPSDNKLAWRWDPDTFGSSTAMPNQNPSGLGTFIYNLRFPGQYYQAETGLFYNFSRTYDPQMSRYIESDPIGLAGGINTYAYTGANPISRVDRFGLAGGPPEAEETEEQREENESALVAAEAARLQAEINSLDPGYGEALPPGYRPSSIDLIRMERLVKDLREQQRCRNPAIQSPPRRVHSEQTLTSGYGQYTYAYWLGQSTQDIVNSLQPNAQDPLTVRPDGTVLDGNTRLLILEQRGYDVNSLPRTIIR